LTASWLSNRGCADDNEKASETPGSAVSEALFRTLKLAALIEPHNSLWHIHLGHILASVLCVPSAQEEYNGCERQGVDHPVR